MLESIGAGALSSPLGMLSLDASTRSLLCGTLTFVLNILISTCTQNQKTKCHSQADLTLRRLARDQLLPCLGTFPNNIRRILPILALARERKLVLRLAIRDLVNTEPLVRCPQKPGQVPLHILDIIQLRGERIIDINRNDLPIRLALVQQCHDAQDLDLLHLAGLGDELADLADVEGVIVTLGFGLRVRGARVFPGLRESAIVPNVAFVGKAVAHEAELAFLCVLLDGVEGLLFRDLGGYMG
jgi:hypothetical protein